jgi:hypothetical protein
MPVEIDISGVTAAREAYAAEATRIEGELRALQADDGRDPAWKARRFAQLRRELDVAGVKASTTVDAAAKKASRQLERELARDTRSATDSYKDLGAELTAQRLAAEPGMSRIMAENRLPPEARRLAELGDLRGALAYARAAAQHGAGRAADLVAELEQSYRATWPGKRELLERQAQLRSDLADFDAAAKAAAASGLQVALETAKALGDRNAEVRLSDEWIATSIGAKNAEYLRRRPEPAGAQDLLEQADVDDGDGAGAVEGEG